MYITVTSHSLPHSTCSPGLDRHVTYRLNTSPIHYSFFISKPTSRVPNIVAECVLLIDSPPTHKFDPPRMRLCTTEPKRSRRVSNGVILRAK
ncbi:hypothetical protein Agabi119p4_2373 [Agaricus bisporus var. burnettii]|uniref:Uncharacterized protein n=1 Tax=Agaricus bisporus var. burnettii TaxID=192524 RepID=A0A8H7F954_AGABI|nr:hypothetical protein Agabi119p4_2373 [Agaricus bisporus var. burnettii]